MTLLRTCAVLLIATTSSLCAVSWVEYGNGITLTMASDTSVYFAVTPGAANAGLTTDGTDTTNSIFQLIPGGGAEISGVVEYGAAISLLLTSNQICVTLNPPADAPVYNTPYVRNNAPQQLGWENLYFVSATGESDGVVMNYNDTVYLAVTYESGANMGVTSYLHLDPLTNYASTVSTTSEATQLTINNATGSLTPYTTPSGLGAGNTAIQYGYWINLGYRANWESSIQYYLSVSPGAHNAGITNSETPTYYEVAGPDYFGGSYQLSYGSPISLSIFNSNGSGPVTMNIPAEYSSFFRNDANTVGVWEQFYFIPVINGGFKTHGQGADLITPRNGDPVFSYDTAYLARNSLYEGNFRTEYLMVDTSVMYGETAGYTDTPYNSYPYSGSYYVGTTYNIDDATPLTIIQNNP